MLTASSVPALSNGTSVERLGGSGGQDLNTWEVLKVCAIECVELRDAVSEQGGSKLSIENVTASDGVLAKKSRPPADQVKWKG